MAKKLIIANWKMNPQTGKEAEKILAGYAKQLKSASWRIKADMVICPPFVFLPLLSCMSSPCKRGSRPQINLDSRLRENDKMKLLFKLGAQDIFWENPPAGGAYTGEISPAMLKDLKCDYVIIGHSERRKYFCETDEMVNKKVLAALKAKLNVILCVGENYRENHNEIPNIVEEQVAAALANVPKSAIGKIIVAYEPIWAIGTGIPDTPEGAMMAAVLIRKTAVGIFGPSAKNLRVIYGGSVNAENAGSFINHEGIDGVLVGGASLNPMEFANIIDGAI